jgi:uncharacterized protein
VRLALALALLTACATPRGLSAPGTPPAVDIALARERRGDLSPAWNPLRPNVFQRALAEGRLVVFDGAANWCHWCHVMDETTWRDPAVLALLHTRFVAAREDVDTRPDLAARYAAWGWPATIILDAQGRELARYRGYLTPAQMLAALRAALRDPTPLADVEVPGGQSLPLGHRLADALDQMDRAYDPALASWGTNQKVALGDNVQVELLRASQGDPAAGARARETLTRQRRIYDPVWGGVYQYSAGTTWDDPHFERLMAFQTPTVRAALRAGRVLDDPAFTRDAQAIGHFLLDHLRDETGAFHGSMDADVNAHDRAARFVDGHVYFALPDAERRRLGLPHVDPGAHPRDNGMAIEALVALHDATHEGVWLSAARQAAAVMRARHVDAEGRVSRAGTRDRLLADAAWLALGLAALAPHDPEAGAVAVRIASRTLDDFATPSGLRAVIPAEVLPGALAGMDVPLGDNLALLRALARLAVRGEDARAVFDRVMSPARIRAHGRFIGEALVTAHDLGVMPAPAGLRAEVDAGEGATLTATLVPAGEGATVRVALRAGVAHVNRTYPTSLTLQGIDARPAVEVRDEGVRGEQALSVMPAATHLRGALRWARCSETTCVPVETLFVLRRPLP